MEAIIFWAVYPLYTFVEAAGTTISRAPELITNFLFIQAVLMAVRFIWKRTHAPKKKSHVAAGVSSVSTGHMSGLHSIFDN